MKKVRVLINSAPRSGHAWLQYLLLKSVNFDNNISMGEIHDQFIIRENVPVTLLAKFPDVVQTTVLRSPLEIIPSVVTKTIGGFGNTRTMGVSMPHENNSLPSLDQLIDGEFNVYKRWSGSIIKNIKELEAFTFEQVCENPEFVVDRIMSKFDYKYNKVNNTKLDELIKEARMGISQHDKGSPGFNNPLPIEKKPDIYYEALDIVKNHKRLEESIDLFNLAKIEIYKNQGIVNG
jgi:hypothetical protein